AKGRLELVGHAPSGAPIFVDYAHTPAALEVAMETLRPYVDGKLVVVFGAGGDRDRGKRPLMGEVAARWSDYVIVTSDNPRTEEPGKIIEEILPGLKGLSPRQYEVIEDRRAAIYRALELAEAGDAVVIVGKGHETYQIVGNQTFPFDDREVAREGLRRLNGG
ncbi:MAG: cyanophycin synthetase, partial [Syntrophomonadaceae bacterium]|nr:cyanophycin synthetase [Syntrophomonadaceae bacterium]